MHALEMNRIKNETVSLGLLLQEAVKDNTNFERAEQMYCAKFRRTEVSTVSKVFQANLADDYSLEEAIDDFTAELGSWLDYTECLDKQIVQICNYKGECEGWEFIEDAEHLPIYRNKEASAAAFFF